MKTEDNMKEKAMLADNKMSLMDGRVIDIYPRKELMDHGIDNALRIDTTGEYLSIYRAKKPKPTAPDSPSPSAEERQFFLDNVFFFVAHSEEILSDSRMFLAPVPVKNGLAYTGTCGFRCPTLGVYLEWWMHHSQTIVVDEQGKLQFYWFISGSPLSGRNACAVVDENGTSEQRPVSGFPNYWRTFKAVNTRYDECKAFGQAYTLRQVKDMLIKNDNHNHDHNYNHDHNHNYIEKAYIIGNRWKANAE